MKLRNIFLCSQKNEYYKEQFHKNKLWVLMVFILSVFLLPSAYAVEGNSTFLNLEPSCSVNQTSVINCSATDVRFHCGFETDSSPLIDSVVFGFNSTSFLSIRDTQINFSKDITLSEQTETINTVYNWSDTTVVATDATILIFVQNITVNKTCPDCFQDIVETNTSCSLSDEFNTSYSDNNACGGTLPSNFTSTCDFCLSNWQCTSFDTACTVGVTERNCLAIEDTSLCYNQTGLASDLEAPALSSFKTPCTTDDFDLTSEILSSFSPVFGVSQYPYIEVNTTVDFTLTVNFNSSPVEISFAQIQFVNMTVPMAFDNDTKTYDVALSFSEIGDYPFILVGDYLGTTLFTINGQLFVREFIDVGVELFENLNQSTRYKNEFAEVIALRETDDGSDRTFQDDIMSTVIPFEKTNLVMKKFIKLNLSSYFNYRQGQRAFHAPYTNGRAQLRLPVEADTVWELRLLNMEMTDEYVFDDFNYATIKTIDAERGNDVLLNSVKTVVDAEFKFLVSNWDVRFFPSALKLGILILMILLGIGAIWFSYSSTGDPSIAVKTVIVLLGAIPTLYIIFSFLIGWLT